jgi:hypothetical protein
MEFHHVCIERENDHSEIVIETDIHKLDLIQRIAKPYETQGNQSFNCDGFLIVKSEVRRIDILKTNLPFSCIKKMRIVTSGIS